MDSVLRLRGGDELVDTEMTTAFNLKGPGAYDECKEAFFREQLRDEYDDNLTFVSRQSQWSRLTEEEKELCQTMPVARRALWGEAPQRRRDRVSLQRLCET